MTFFEQRGVQLQQECETHRELNHRFSYSCCLCCAKGLKIDCDRCAIALAHTQMQGVIDDMFAAKEREAAKADRIRVYISY